jgi:transglutaminase-like putative cysteine protease
MRSLVLESLQSQKLCKLASAIYAGTAYSSDKKLLIDRVDNFLRSSFMYVPEEIETIQTPEYMIIGKEINGFFYGDCDDISTLEAAILTCLGIATRFVCIRSKPDTNTYDHVYIEANSGSGWVVSDITVPREVVHHWFQRLEIAI